MAERTRMKRKELKFSDEEWNMIEQKMGQIGTNNFSIYARKMLIDGYIIKRDYSELKSITGELGKIGSNINQIAKRANETRNVYEEDVKNVLKMLHDLQIIVNDKIGKLI